MEFQRILALRGPNIWATFPVLEAWLDLGAFKDSSSAELPGFNDRLKLWIPSLFEHRCSVGEPGGFFQRLERGTYLAHILEHVVLELQCLAGMKVGYGKTRLTHQEGVYKVAIEYKEEYSGKLALEAARNICLSANADTNPEIDLWIEKIKQSYEKYKLTPLQEALRKQARKRGIPFQILAQDMIQLGQGFKQRRIKGSLTDHTSAVASWIAYDWYTASKLLADVGLPVPSNIPVSELLEVEASASQMGFPLLLRPRYTSKSNPAIPIESAELLGEVFAKIKAKTHYMLAEPIHKGQRVYALVVGSEIASYLEDIDGAWVPKPISDYSGALSQAVLMAAKVIGLDVAELELDVNPSASFTILGIRANPDISYYLKDDAAWNHAASALLNLLFAEGDEGRIPVAAVTGVNGKTTTTRIIAHLLAQEHSPVLMTCTEGIYLADQRLFTGDCSGPKSAKCALQHALAKSAALENARGGMLREGLGFDRCQAAVVVNIGQGDHLGFNDIETLEELAYAKSTLVAATHSDGYAVLNADDTLVVGMQQYCSAKIIFFSQSSNNEIVENHRKSGGRAVFLKVGTIILAEGNNEQPLLNINQVPITHGGLIEFQVENTLAAVGGAWACGVTITAIAQGLKSFVGGLIQAPGRFNMLELNGVTIVLDYGHNTSALSRLIEAIKNLPHKRRIVVYSAAGDRRNCDIIEQGKLLGDHFDRVVLYEDTYLRGREPGEIFALFREGLNDGIRVKDVEEVRGGVAALKSGLEKCLPGDLLVIQPDSVDDAVEFLSTRLKESNGREINMDSGLSGGLSNGLWVENSKLKIVHGPLGKAINATDNLVPGEVILKAWGKATKVRTMHTIQISSDGHIVPEHPLGWFNHSCEPNCGLLIKADEQITEAHALRHIAANEELTFDYATFEYEIHHMPEECLCNAKKCRGSISGYKDMPEELREMYGDYIASYLKVFQAEVAR